MQIIYTGHIETTWSHVDGLILFDSFLNNRVNTMNNKQLKIDVDDDVTWSAYKWLIPVSWTFPRGVGLLSRLQAGMY